MTWSGAGSAASRLLAGGRPAEHEDRLQPGASPALDVGGDAVADHRHPLGAGDQPERRLEQVAARACRRSRPAFRGRLDRRQGRAGAGPGPVGHRQGRVAAGREEGRAALQGARRGQQLGVVELAVAGDDHRVGFAPGLALQQLEAGRGDELLEPRRPDHEGGRRPDPLGRQLGGRRPGGHDPAVRRGDPDLAQPLGVGVGRPHRVVGDEDDLLAGVEQRAQRLDGPRQSSRPPDDPVEVDQKSVEAVGQRHAAQASDGDCGSIR